MRSYGVRPAHPERRPPTADSGNHSQVRSWGWVSAGYRGVWIKLERVAPPIPGIDEQLLKDGVWRNPFLLGLSEFLKIC